MRLAAKHISASGPARHILGTGWSMLPALHDIGWMATSPRLCPTLWRIGRLRKNHQQQRRSCGGCRSPVPPPSQAIGAGRALVSEGREVSA